MQMNPNVSQRQVLAGIRTYLNRNHRDGALLKQFNEGYCSGISSVWLYSRWLQTQPNPFNKARDDYQWFKATIELIAGWDRQRELTSKEAIEFERFISLIQYFQRVFDYFPVQQGDLDQSLEDTVIGKERDLRSLRETKIAKRDDTIEEKEIAAKQEDSRKLTKEYAIASLFTLEQLKQLLKTENIIQDGKLIYITSLKHATALFRNGSSYYFFDPNSNTGEATTASLDDIAERIFAAYDFTTTRPSPLGLRIYSFTHNPSVKYPAQKSLLAGITPRLITDPEVGCANGVLALFIAAYIGSAETVNYLLEIGADPTVPDKNGGTVFIVAATRGYTNVIVELLKSKKIENADALEAFKVATACNHREAARLIYAHFKEDLARQKKLFFVEFFMFVSGVALICMSKGIAFALVGTPFLIIILMIPTFFILAIPVYKMHTFFNNFKKTEDEIVKNNEKKNKEEKENELEKVRKLGIGEEKLFSVPSLTPTRVVLAESTLGDAKLNFSSITKQQQTDRPIIPAVVLSPSVALINQEESKNYKQ